MTRSLKLFVGSGNLGNAEPDAQSMAFWLPDDGKCSEVVENQKYPIVATMQDFDDEEPKQDPSHSENDEDDNIHLTRSKNQDQFDIIVLGMQESTFEPEVADEEVLEDIKVALDLNDDSEKEQKSVSSASERPSKVLAESMQQVAKHAGKAAKTAGKTAGKTAAQVAKVGVKSAEKAEKAARKGVDNR